ncbi:hypothetical protein Hdeb2414_s0008g00280051 [Helianthus debilis subsp. tardiflorus]
MRSVFHVVPSRHVSRFVEREREMRDERAQNFYNGDQLLLGFALAFFYLIAPNGASKLQAIR